MKLILAAMIGAILGLTIGFTVAAMLASAKKRDMCMEKKTEDKN